MKVSISGSSCVAQMKFVEQTMADVVFLRLHFRELVKSEEPDLLLETNQRPGQSKEGHLKPLRGGWNAQMYRKLRESGLDSFQNNLWKEFF